MLRVFIDYSFPGWNEYISAERTSFYKANSMKQDEKKYIVYTIKEKYQGGYPVTLTIRPHFKNRKRDLDNFRMKGLIDGLVAAGVIRNDNLTCIDRIILEPLFSDQIGVEVIIEESRLENG